MSPSIGRSASSDMTVNVPRISLWVASGMTAAVAPFSRNGISGSCPPPSAAAVVGSSTTGVPLWNTLGRSGERGCDRERIARIGSASRSWRTCTATGTSWSPRSCGMRRAAPSMARGSTIVRAAASSLSSRERVLGEEREISYSARGPERELEQALADSHVRAREAALRCGLEPVVFDEVDGQPLCRQQLPHAFDGGLERVRERELGDRLADDREERLGALEVLGKRPATFAGTERVRGADGKSGESRQQRAVGIRCLGEDELEGTQRRLPELKGGES